MNFGAHGECRLNYKIRSMRLFLWLISTFLEKQKRMFLKKVIHSAVRKFGLLIFSVSNYYQ